MNKVSLEKAYLAIAGKDRKLAINPTQIVLPEERVRYLHSIGYDTEEKIQELVDNLLCVSSDGRAWNNEEQKNRYEKGGIF